MLLNIFFMCFLVWPVLVKSWKHATEVDILKHYHDGPHVTAKALRMLMLLSDFIPLKLMIPLRPTTPPCGGWLTLKALTPFVFISAHFRLLSPLFCSSIDLFSHQPSWQGKVGRVQRFYISRLCFIQMEKRPDGIHLRSIAALNGIFKMAISKIAPTFQAHAAVVVLSISNTSFFFFFSRKIGNPY